jgi:hypothetical protein
MLSALKTLAIGVMMALSFFLFSLEVWGIPPIFNEEFFVEFLVSADEKTRFEALSLPGIERRIIAAKAYVRIYSLVPPAPDKVLNFMAYCLGSSLDVRAQLAFVNALGDIGRPPSNRVLVALLYDGLKSKHVSLRRAAWEALQKLFTPAEFHQFVVRHLVLKEPLYEDFHYFPY